MRVNLLYLFYLVYLGYDAGRRVRNYAFWLTICVHPTILSYFFIYYSLLLLFHLCTDIPTYILINFSKYTYQTQYFH